MYKETKTFQETLAPYAEKLLQGLEKGIDYAQQELPIVLEQYVLYEAITGWLLVLFSIIILITGIKLGNRLRKSERDYEPLDFLSYFISFIISPIVFFYNIPEAIQATFFPKLFLVKEFLNYI